MPHPAASPRSSNLLEAAPNLRLWDEGAGWAGYDAATADNGKPIFTLDQIIHQLTRSGRSWNGVTANPVNGVGTITYAFFDTAMQVYSSERSEFQPLTLAQRAAFRLAFDLWEDLTGIRFVEGNTFFSDINIGNLDTTETHFGAYAYGPGFARENGDIWVNMNSETNFDLSLGSAGFRTILHEIGHALGISHPGNYNAEEGVTLTYQHNAEYYQDSYQYTIMSYFGSSSTGANRTGFASTPFLHDVAAIQHLYGTNPATRLGDTVYGFNSTADRDAFNFTLQASPVVTIWDSGGVDTLDFSGWSSPSLIDLESGAFSHGGGQTHNVAIAFGTLIENAVGGAGNDRVSGNSADNLFFLQHGGDDAAFALGGADGFYFGAAMTVLDEVDGGAGPDSLALHGRYDGLELARVTGIETLSLLSASDPSYGGGQAGGSFSYRLTGVDLNVAASALLEVIGTGLRAGEDLSFDGSAEMDGDIHIYTGLGNDTLKAGAGMDGFLFGAENNLDGADRIFGGAGTDTVALRGHYQVTFSEASFDSIEVLVLLSGHTNEYGGFIVAGGFDYAVVMAQGNVAAGSRLDVIGSTLAANESLWFEGQAEGDGSYRIISGAGDDRLSGSQNADLLYGGRGVDLLQGNGGADTYVYLAADESTAAAMDVIQFGLGDRIDLSGIDASQAAAGDQGFSFIGSAAFSGTAGELRLFLIDGQFRIEGDVNGDGLADLVIGVQGAEPLQGSDFLF